MKLYTEEQLILAIKMARTGTNIFSTPFYYDDFEILERIKPIQIPVDDEIDKAVDEHLPNHKKDLYGERLCFELGAKWIRNKIQGGNK